ncbi:MAG: ABC transporter permease [Myxococcaceae bacterium]|nr:ABC transporter permease [Myxococcaceae bacterium]MCA3013192.1 ABC transporter permease [Myxococcaceae bacterium]
MFRNLLELYQYRALLWALSMRELKARYRASVLGFLWTFLNPTLSMAVYGLVFGFIMSSSQERYPFYLLSGLLPWICFSTSVLGGTTSISDRKDLLTKVRFPAQVLPAYVVLTNVLNLVFSLPLLFLLAAVYGDAPSWHVVLVPVLLALQSLFTLAVTYLLSALNVAFRDLQHIIANVMQLAFFLTPVLWPLKDLDGKRFGLELSGAELQQLVVLLNPMAALTEAWRDVLFRHQTPAWQPLAGVVAVTFVVLWFSAAVFERRREEFAELV